MGGILTDALSWEWIFFVNVPVGVLAIVLAPILLDESRDSSVKTFDLPGAALVTAGLSSLVYAITQAGQEGWLAGRTIGFAVVSLALLAGFVGWELRHPEPLMRFGLLRTKTVAGANVAGFIMGTAMFSMFLMLTLYMQQVLGYSAMETGVAYLAVAGTAIIWSGVAAQLVTRVGVKPVLVSGMAFLTAGLVFFTQVSVGGSYVDRSPAGVPAHRSRDRLLVRADHDRGARGRRARRGRTGLRADQHVAADRRCPRDRGTLDHRDLANRRCRVGRSAGAQRIGRRIHRRLRRRRHHRGHRDRRRPHPHPA